MPTIMVIGPTGAGKSAFLNWLAQSPSLFESEMSPTGVTLNHMVQDTPKARLIDTVGLGDPQFSDDDMIRTLGSAIEAADNKRIVEVRGAAAGGVAAGGGGGGGGGSVSSTVTDTKQGIQMIAFVIRADHRVDAAVLKTWPWFVKQMGGALLTRAILILTHADVFRTDAERDRWFATFQRSVGRDILSQCDDRYFFVNCSPSNISKEDTTRDIVYRTIAATPTGHSYHYERHWKAQKELLRKEAKDKVDAEVESKRAEAARLASLQAQVAAAAVTAAAAAERASWVNVTVQPGQSCTLPQGKYIINGYMRCEGAYKVTMSHHGSLSCQSV